MVSQKRAALSRTGEGEKCEAGNIQCVQLDITMKVRASEALQYVCTTCLMFVLVVCDYEHTCTPETFSGSPHPNGACGSEIDSMVSMVCSFTFKRSARSIDAEKILYDRDELSSSSLALKPVKKRLSNADAFPHSRALQFLRSRRVPYEDQNIVCECCYHDCSIMEWQQYC